MDPAGEELRAVAVVDVDGTLVDSNYHHAIAWSRALRRYHLVVPLHVIHRHVGMGGDKLIEAVAGTAAERSHGDDIRAAEAELFEDLIEEVEPIEGAEDAIRRLSRDGTEVVLSSSARAGEVEHYIGLLGIGDAIAGHTTAADVDRTKPDPDLISAALRRSNGGPARMIGDTPWDVEAASRAGIDAIGVMTGGFCELELREAGAATVVGSIASVDAALLRSELVG